MELKYLFDLHTWFVRALNLEENKKRGGVKSLNGWKCNFGRSRTTTNFFLHMATQGGLKSGNTMKVRDRLGAPRQQQIHQIGEGETRSRMNTSFSELC
jgi:hypothetical protein